MENNKETLETELQEIRSDVGKFKRQQEGEIKTLEAEKYLPLIEQAKNIKDEIYSTVTTKYKADFAALYEKERELEKAINVLKVQEAANIWHPQGTIVTLHKCRSGWHTSNIWSKTDKTGTVQIYDGTQELPGNMRSWSLPKKGDVVVFHNKKDGSMGLKFDMISEYGRLRNWFPMWLAEGETPTDNLKTKLDAKEAIAEEV